MQKMKGTQVQFLGLEDPLEEEVATQSSILASKIPWMEEPDGLRSMDSPRVIHDWTCTRTHTHTHTWHCWPFCYKGREPCSWVAVLPHLDSLVLIDSDYWPLLFSCSWSRAQTSSPAETTVALPHGGPRINLLLHSPQGRCHFLLDLLCATHWLSFPWWPGLIKVCFFYWCF